LYKLVKELCLKKGIPVNELEINLGFSRGSICKWGESRPSIDRVVAVAEYFGVPIDYFLDGLKETKKEKGSEHET
jgi:transcriptional regulator with XRE-family HTH domain